MHTKVSIMFLTNIAALVLLGCSTPQAQVIEAVPAPESRPQPLVPYSYRIPNEPAPPESNIAGGKVCQLGTSCLAMDPRPFEFCLVGTQKRCSDKVREPLLVENPEVEPR